MIKGLTSKEDFENMFPVEQLDTIGDQWLIKWRGSQTLRYSIYLETVKDVLTKYGTQKILDIGCGQSNFLMLLRQYYPFMEYYGTDISENVILWNQKSFPFIQYKQCALPDVGVPPGSFDFISALEVLYYLDEQQRQLSLQNMAAALKPGGHLLISGVLDGGQSYFAEDWIVQAVTRILSIEKVTYNYARCYTRLERWLLRPHGVFNRARQIIDISASEFQEHLTKKRTGASIVTTLRLPILRTVGKAATLLAVRLLRGVLGWVWLPCICSEMTKWTMRGNGKSHIIILARKEQSVLSPPEGEN